MFRFLISNCRPNVLSNFNQNVTQHTIGKSANVKEFLTTLQKARNNFFTLKNKKQNLLNNKSNSKLSTKNIILSSLGAGISIGFIAKSRGYNVYCDEQVHNRLAAIVPKDFEKNKFDLKQFWKYLKPYILEFVGAVIAALAVAYFNIKIPNLLGELVNTLAKYANTFVKDPHNNSFISDVKGPASSLLGIYILQSGFTFIYIVLLTRIGESMAKNIREDLFKKIILQDLSFFDKNRTGELVNRLTADVQDFKSSFKQFVSQGLRCAAQLIGGAISLFVISPHMAGIALASVPLVITFMTYLGKTLRELSKKAQAQAEAATIAAEEAIANIRTVRSCSAEYRECELFAIQNNYAAELSEQLGYGIAVFQGLTNFFLNSLVLSTLFLGGHLISTDSLTPGQLMAFLVASQGVQRSLSQGSILLGTMIRGLSAGARVFDYLAIEPKIDIIKGYTIPPDNLHGEIKFENITFSYPTRPDQIVLKNFNLILKPGQTVALVGASGSGKSTIAALLERFYEPVNGTIKIDGYDLKYISPFWLRSQVIGFIDQQPILFATSVLENIRYSKPNATEIEILEAAKISQSHEFVMALPDAYETNVGERGAQLSGGQRQRIAIARALIKNPLILILDEATSALDASSEAEVQKALDNAVANRTTLIIAHRLSTIKNADVIVVLDQGKIVEMGKHDELISRKGLYYDLVKQQEKKIAIESENENTLKSAVGNNAREINTDASYPTLDPNYHDDDYRKQG